MASTEANEFEALLETAPSAQRPNKPVSKAARLASYRNAPIRVSNLYDESIDYVAAPEHPRRPKPSRARHDAKREQLSDLGFEDYSDYLQSSHWLKKRRELLRSERMYACISCGKTKGLHVHHRTYNNIGNEPLGDLDYLCERCHDLAHKAARTLAGVSLWTCSRQIADLIRLGFGSDRFDPNAWNQKQTKPKKVVKAKRKSLAKRQARNRRRRAKANARKQKGSKN